MGRDVIPVGIPGRCSVVGGTTELNTDRRIVRLSSSGASLTLGEICPQIHGRRRLESVALVDRPIDAVTNSIDQRKIPPDTPGVLRIALVLLRREGPNRGEIGRASCRERV